MTTSHPIASQRAVIATQALATILGGLVMFLGIIFLGAISYQLLYAGRIFPGVRMAGVDLSGESPDKAALKLNERLPYPIGGKVVLRWADKGWLASPVQLGMVLDSSAAARAAYNLGRQGDPIGALDSQLRAGVLGYEVAPVIIFDQRVAYQYLQSLAQQVDQPVLEATLQISGTDVTAIPGQAGRTVDIEATLADLSTQLQTFRDGEVELIVREAQPSATDVSAQAEVARQVLAQPLQLVMPNSRTGDPGPWVYQPEVLGKLIGIEKVQEGVTDKIRVSLNADTLGQMLSDIAPQVDRPAANARFRFNDSTGQLIALAPSATGRTLDVEASIQAITQALLSGEHSVQLVVTDIQPAVADTATAKELGITGLLPNGVQTSYFYGSHAERAQNITIAAARFDGVLVAPGETFSMGDTLGDVSLDNGYAEAPIIYGGRTIQGVGGGVCQVSTTLFRTVFFAGFPVVERVPHAYRVSYYEQTASGRDASLAGLDATVYFPLVDFKFKNDSPYWILMETYVRGSSLTWKLYSTYDGRKVEWETTGPTNLVPAPEPLFQPNADLNPGQITQTDYAAEGADVTVDRTVLKDGAEYFQDEFQTHYQAWQAICEYAPGLDNPEKAAKRLGICQAPGS